MLFFLGVNYTAKGKTSQRDFVIPEKPHQGGKKPLRGSALKLNSINSE